MILEERMATINRLGKTEGAPGYPEPQPTVYLYGEKSDGQKVVVAKGTMAEMEREAVRLNADVERRRRQSAAIIEAAMRKRLRKQAARAAIKAGGNHGE